MREQEEAWKEKLRALKEKEAHEREEAHYNEVVDPVVKDIENMLAATGDKVSAEGLQALAKWKLSL